MKSLHILSFHLFHGSSYTMGFLVTVRQTARVRNIVYRLYIYGEKLHVGKYLVAQVRRVKANCANHALEI